jgi:transcriptional regulator with XRE-family HTH domain
MPRPPKPSPEEQRRRLEEDLRAGRLTLQEAARRLRKSLGLNQKEFALQLGIGPRTYIDFERGVGNPTLNIMEKIAHPFGWRVGFILEPSGGQQHNDRN